MKISIVVPVYNVAPWIAGCLRSIFRQREEASDLELECIVVDDCGTDRTMEVLEQVAPEAKGAGVDFHVVSHIRNRGQAAARNTGTSVATGDYIFYLDGEDELEGGELGAMAEWAGETGFPDWVQGNYRRVTPDGRTREETLYYNPAQPLYGDRQAVVAHFDCLNFTNATNKLLRLDFIRENRLEFRDGLIYEDALWCMQAYEVVERIATLEPLTYRHNLREGSTMRSAMTETKLDSLLYIVRQMAAMPRDCNVEHRAVFNAVYGLKNLYMGTFRSAYRRQWMEALWDTGVQHMEGDSAALPPFSRWVARALNFPLVWARVTLWLLLCFYRLFRRLRGTKGEH